MRTKEEIAADNAAEFYVKEEPKAALGFKQVRSLLDDYTDEKRPNISDATEKLFESAGRHILRFMDITGKTWCEGSMTSFIEYAKQGRAPGTTKKIVIFARAWTKWAFDSGKLQKPFYTKLHFRYANPMVRCPSIPFEKYFPRIREIEPVTGHLFVLGYMTGMAIADCSFLKWSQVHFEEGFIIIRRQKTNELCQIPIDQKHLLPHLLALREDFDLNPPEPADFEDDQVNEYVCTEAAELYFKGSGLQNRLVRACEKMGLPCVRWHDLRRAFCTRLLNNGVNAIIASRMTGHRTIAVLNRYATISTDTLRKSFDSANSTPVRHESFGMA